MATELTDITGLGDKTAKKLEKAGIDDVDTLANADVKTVADVGMSESRASKFINKAQESAVIIQSGDEVEDEYDSLNYINTGIDGLDEIIGGGWKQGDIIALYGATSSGKTQMGFKAMVQAVEQTGDPAVYIETERNNYQPDRINSFADSDNVIEDIYRVKAYDLDRLINSYGKIEETFDEVSIIVIDSLTGPFRVSDQYQDRSNFSDRSNAMAEHLNAIDQMAQVLECPVIVTGQVYENPSQWGGSEAMYGGSVLMHKVFYFIHMKESSGEIIKGTVEGHPGQPESSIEMNVTDTDIVSL